MALLLKPLLKNTRRGRAAHRRAHLVTEGHSPRQFGRHRVIKDTAGRIRRFSFTQSERKTTVMQCLYNLYAALTAPN